MSNFASCVRPFGWRGLVVACMAAGAFALAPLAHAAKSKHPPKPAHVDATPGTAKSLHGSRASIGRGAHATRSGKATRTAAASLAAPAAVAATAALAAPALLAPSSIATTATGAAAVIQPEAAGADPRAGTELVLRALSLLGVNYKLGGNSPDTGLDCSGLVRHVFREVVGLVLPRRAEEISRAGEVIVDTAQLKPGDLVFFNTLRRTFSHVGIYIGNNQFVHAPSSGGAVRVENLEGSYWLRRFNGARRVLFGDAGLDKATAAEMSTLTGLSPESLTAAIQTAGTSPR